MKRNAKYYDIVFWSNVIIATTTKSWAQFIIAILMMLWMSIYYWREYKHK